MTQESTGRRQKSGASDLPPEASKESLPQSPMDGSSPKEPTRFYGFDPLPHRGTPVSNELIDELLDSDEV